MIFNLANEADCLTLKTAFTGRNVGLTSGTYDLFHYMHLVYLERCRRLCDILVVGVDSNDLVQSRKGPTRPLVPEHQRLAIVAAVSCVQAAFILGTVADFGLAVEKLGVSTIFKNDCFKQEEVVGADKAKVIIIPDVVNFSSTTELIEQIQRSHEHKKATL